MSDTNQNNLINRNDLERNTNSLKSQDIGDSTITRRTLVERGLRPVNDGKTTTGQSSTITAMITINQQHKDEQRELQELNKKFANYLDRVQYLEDYNQRLIDDLNTLRETWGGDGTELHAKYGPQLKTLRNGIDNALRDHALQELQLKRQEYDLWQIQQQIATFDDDEDINRLNFLKQELNASNMEIELLKNLLDQRFPELSRQQVLMDNLLKELNGLKNELDTHQLERIILESELQTLKEHSAFQNSIHRAQRKELLSLSTPVIDASRFYRIELAHAISDIRQDFEILSQSQANELEEYYRIKTEEVRSEIESENERKRLLASQGFIESMDTTSLTSSLRDSQNDLMSLQAENKQLQSILDAIIDDFEKIQDEHLREKQFYDQEFAVIREQINDKQDTIDNLVQNTVSLRFEMSTYRRLLDVEEKHINKVEQGQQLQTSSILTSGSPSTSKLASGSPSTLTSGSPSTSKLASGSPSTSILASGSPSTSILASGSPLASTSSYQNQPTTNRALSDLETKKMTVQKTARGPISFDSVDLETDAVILVNERYSGNEQSLNNWTIRRQIDQQPEIIYQFPSAFSLRSRQTVRIFSKRSPYSAKAIGDRLIADRIDTWGIGQKMVTRLIDDNNEEKAIIIQIFQ